MYEQWDAFSTASYDVYSARLTSEAIRRTKSEVARTQQLTAQSRLLIAQVQRVKAESDKILAKVHATIDAARISSATYDRSGAEVTFTAIR
jgi:uncharacterized coiled-coil DUF342 family protein